MIFYVALPRSPSVAARADFPVPDSPIIHTSCRIPFSWSSEMSFSRHSRRVLVSSSLPYKTNGAGDVEPDALVIDDTTDDVVKVLR